MDYQQITPPFLVVHTTNSTILALYFMSGLLSRMSYSSLLLSSYNATYNAAHGRRITDILQIGVMPWIT
jgi:hypothetical protein